MPLFEVIRALKVDGAYYGPGHPDSIGNEIELEDEDQIQKLIDGGAIQEQTYGQEEVAALKEELATLKSRLQAAEQESRTKMLSRKLKAGPQSGKVISIKDLRLRRRAS